MTHDTVFISLQPFNVLPCYSYKHKHILLGFSVKDLHQVTHNLGLKSECVIMFNPFSISATNCLQKQPDDFGIFKPAWVFSQSATVDIIHSLHSDRERAQAVAFLFNSTDKPKNPIFYHLWIAHVSQNRTQFRLWAQLTKLTLFL